MSVTTEEEEFNAIIPKLPTTEGEVDCWTYQLFCGILRDDMEYLLKPLSLQTRSQYRTLQRRNPQT